MFSGLQLDAPARRHFLRRAAIAPLCLCLVAGLHAVRVATCNQTPWKGGGFGMFSTVDSEAARFVRAFAVTEQGELPLVIPVPLEKRVWELRAAPTAAEAQALANKLAELAWQRPDLQQIGQGQQIIAAHSGQPITSAARCDQNSQSRARRCPLPACRADWKLVPTDEKTSAADPLLRHSRRAVATDFRPPTAASTASSYSQ